MATLSNPPYSALPSQPIDLVNALLELEASASNDEAIRAKIASYPPSIADVSLLKNLQNKSEGEKLKKQVWRQYAFQSLPMKLKVVLLRTQKVNIGLYCTIK